MSEEPWFAVRCVFRFELATEPSPLYEERITLWRADSFEEAIELAESEAASFTRDAGGTYTGLAQCFHLAVGDAPTSGDEVFSLMRSSNLDPDDYIHRFFDTGTERQEAVE